MTWRAEVPLIWRAGAEISLWFALASGFLWHYVSKAGVDDSVWGEHLSVFGTGVLCLLLLRVSVAVLMRGRWARWAQAVLTFVYLFLWVGFYALVLVGLRHWGEVITLDILRVYVQQSQTLLVTLGLSPWILASFVLILTSLGLLALFGLHRNHWAQELMAKYGLHRLVYPYFGLLALMLVQVFNFHAHLNLPTHEPLALLLSGNNPKSDQVLADAGPGGEVMRQAAIRERQNYQPSANALKVNLILIVVDALRDDHLSVNGYKRATTPHLQRWLNQTGGVTLGQARSSCASSICGISSIVTSRYSHEQSPEAMSLHEVLARHGWSTHLLMGGDHTNFYGLRQLYGQVDSYVDGTQARAPAMLNDDRFLLESLKALAQDVREPTFLHLHLMSAHVLGRRFFGLGEFGPSSNYVSPLFKLNGGDLQRAMNYYDEGVLQVDSVIDQALNSLKKNGLLEHSLVLITGDHGEHLGEHGRFSHANGLLEPVVRVPWIMLPFGIDLSQINLAGRHHQVDMAPTILDLLHISKPTSWSGVSLLASDRNPAFSFLRQGTELGLVDHRSPEAEYKYTIDAKQSSEQVVDLKGDPQELSPIQIETALLQEWRELLLPQMLNAVWSKN